MTPWIDANFFLLLHTFHVSHMGLFSFPTKGLNISCLSFHFYLHLECSSSFSLIWDLTHLWSPVSLSRNWLPHLLHSCSISNFNLYRDLLISHSHLNHPMGGQKLSLPLPAQHLTQSIDLSHVCWRDKTIYNLKLCFLPCRHNSNFLLYLKKFLTHYYRGLHIRNNKPSSQHKLKQSAKVSKLFFLNYSLIKN
jgi:hypothetical protein